MKRIPLFLVLLLIGSAPITAQAYCCWNEAICKAVCGSRCCGSGNFVSVSGAAALGKFNRADINRELQAARDCDPRIRRSLQRQVRAAPAPDRYR